MHEDLNVIDADRPGRVLAPGKVAIVTAPEPGSARRSVDVVAAGATVAVTELGAGATQEVAESIERDARCKAVDRPLEVADEWQVGQTVDRLLEEGGRIDVLVNDTGYDAVEPIWELFTESWLRGTTLRSANSAAMVGETLSVSAGLYLHA